MKSLGFHYRLTEIQATLAISQLKRINKFLNARDFTFDVSDVSSTISIKSKLLSGDTIKPQNRNIKLL